MPDLVARILDAVARPSYTPLKPKVLAKRLGVDRRRLPGVPPHPPRTHPRRPARAWAGNQTSAPPTRTAPSSAPTAAAAVGHGFVRPHPVDGQPKPDILIREGKALDAATGDEVVVRITRQATASRGRGRGGRADPGAGHPDVRRHLLRAGRRRASSGWTAPCSPTASLVGDPGAKGARPQDKVVLEMLRFPDRRRPRRRRHHRGARAARRARAWTRSRVIRAFGLPEEFPEAALAEARARGRRLPTRRPRRPRGLHRATWSSPSTRWTPGTSTTP